MKNQFILPLALALLFQNPLYGMLATTRAQCVGPYTGSVRTTTQQGTAPLFLKDDTQDQPVVLRNFEKLMKNGAFGAFKESTGYDVQVAPVAFLTHEHALSFLSACKYDLNRSWQHILASTDKTDKKVSPEFVVGIKGIIDELSSLNVTQQAVSSLLHDVPDLQHLYDQTRQNLKNIGIRTRQEHQMRDEIKSVSAPFVKALGETILAAIKRAFLSSLMIDFEVNQKLTDQVIAEILQKKLGGARLTMPDLSVRAFALYESNGIYGLATSCTAQIMDSGVPNMPITRVACTPGILIERTARDIYVGYSHGQFRTLLHKIPRGPAYWENFFGSLTDHKPKLHVSESSYSPALSAQATAMIHAFLTEVHKIYQSELFLEFVVDEKNKAIHIIDIHDYTRTVDDHDTYVNPKDTSSDYHLAVHEASEGVLFTPNRGVQIISDPSQVAFFHTPQDALYCIDKQPLDKDIKALVIHSRSSSLSPAINALSKLQKPIIRIPQKEWTRIVSKMAEGLTALLDVQQAKIFFVESSVPVTEELLVEKGIMRKGRLSSNFPLQLTIEPGSSANKIALLETAYLTDAHPQATLQDLITKVKTESELDANKALTTILTRIAKTVQEKMRVLGELNAATKKLMRSTLLMYIKGLMSPPEPLFKKETEQLNNLFSYALTIAGQLRNTFLQDTCEERYLATHYLEALLFQSNTKGVLDDYSLTYLCQKIELQNILVKSFITPLRASGKISEAILDRRYFEIAFHGWIHIGDTTFSENVAQQEGLAWVIFVDEIAQHKKDPPLARDHQFYHLWQKSLNNHED